MKKYLGVQVRVRKLCWHLKGAASALSGSGNGVYAAASVSVPRWPRVELTQSGQHHYTRLYAQLKKNLINNSD